MRTKILKIALSCSFVVSLCLPVLAGSASYYSSGYEGRKMANGQRFSHGRVSNAASGVYPLGTRLRVSHRGRAVVVTITDRCRCYLDLSKAAFRQLAPLSVGRIPVSVSRL